MLGMSSTRIEMSTVGVAPGSPLGLLAAVPTATTVPVEIVPSGNSTSIGSPECERVVADRCGRRDDAGG